jgi:hypothetical protein
MISFDVLIETGTDYAEVVRAVVGDAGTPSTGKMAPAFAGEADDE